MESGRRDILIDASSSRPFSTFLPRYSVGGRSVGGQGISQLTTCVAY